jgi:hypothetical protein
VTPPPLFRAALVAILKNEAANVAEWLEYHALLGVEHAFLFDNNSDDDLRAVLRPYLVQGRATLIDWPSYPGQVAAYNYALRMFGPAAEWLLFLDCDEFVVIDGGGLLPDRLDRLGDADQVLLSWMMFGSSGHVERPNGLVIESFTRRRDRPEPEVKCVVRPHATRSVDVHHATTVCGRTVDALGRRVPERARLADPVAGPIRIHHYFTKSEAEWAAKRRRRQADGGAHPAEAFATAQGDVVDLSAAATAEAVRAALARTASLPGPVHVSHAHSALSELTASREWTRVAWNQLRKLAAVLASDGVGCRRDCTEAVAVLVAEADGAVADGTVALDRLRDRLAADQVAEIAMTAGTAVGVVIDAPQEIGRIYVDLQGSSSAAGTLSVAVVGVDSAGKPCRAELEFSHNGGWLIAAGVVGARTIRVQSGTIRWDAPDDAHGTVRLWRFI